jgi:peptide/nickel transport system ATP-binding protein
MRLIPMTSSKLPEAATIEPPLEEKVLLSVRDLRTHFFADEGTTRAVDGVSFDVTAGRTLGIVGESGCGKSITARSLLGIVSPPGRIISGEILLRRDGGDGGWVDLAKLPPDGPEIRRVRGGDIGLVFQEPMSAFSPVHSVGDQIAEAVRLHRAMSKQEAEERTLELLRMVGIPRPDGVRGEYSWQLSGGLRQRAMIAMALAGQPRLLIADEPTTALDVTTQAQILQLIRDLKRDTGMAVMLITHDLGVIAEMADEVLVVYLGRVVERGPVEEIFNAPRHPYTRALLDSIPSMQSVARKRLPSISGSVPHPFNRPSGCAFHPRCRHALAGRCESVEPATYRVDAQHEVTCHLHDPEVVSGNRIDLPLLAPRFVEAPDEAVTRVAPANDDDPVLLQVEKLTKFFPIRSKLFGRVRARVRAVDEVTFDVRQGETLSLVGESGSGKTTAARAILRALDPDSGEILFHRPRGVVDLAALSRQQVRPLRNELQMIFQDPYSSLNPRMTVLDIVGEPLKVNGVGSRQERVERVVELLKLVGLRPEYLRRFPHAFSGGQRQRIGIARALALNPRLVVADEPVSALDVSVQAQILNLLIELQDRLGLTYLFVSHDLSVVKHISDRIAVMYVGQVVELGTRDEVLFTPKHPYTATLLAAVPRPDPTSRVTFTPPRGEIADPTNPPSGCYFHPRCPFAVDRCRTERPVWQEISPGRRVRCHRAEELELGGIAV